MQASVTFPYNTLQSYNTGNTYQDYQLTIPCPVTPSQTPTVSVTPGSPPLILEPGAVSGGNNTASVTVQPTYQNGQIQFTVRATPDSQYVNTTTNVIINLTVQVTYEYSSATDGVTPTAAVTMFQGSMSNYPCPVHGSDAQNDPFYGHNPSVVSTTTYPSGSLFSASVALQPPPAKRLESDAGDVVLNVTGNGDVSCATVYVQVNVDLSSQQKK